MHSQRKIVARAQIRWSHFLIPLFHCNLAWQLDCIINQSCQPPIKSFSNSSGFHNQLDSFTDKETGSIRASGDLSKLLWKASEEDQEEEETTTSCNEEAAPKEISVNAAMGAVLLDLDDIFTLKERKKALECFS